MMQQKEYRNNWSTSEREVDQFGNNQMYFVCVDLRLCYTINTTGYTFTTRLENFKDPIQPGIDTDRSYVSNGPKLSDNWSAVD